MGAVMPRNTGCGLMSLVIKLTGWNFKHQRRESYMGAELISDQPLRRCCNSHDSMAEHRVSGLKHASLFVRL